MRERILDGLNKSYEGFYYHPKFAEPLRQVPFPRKTGNKRKRNKEFEDFYEYHDTITPVVQTYHRNHMKRRKISHSYKNTTSLYNPPSEKEDFESYIRVSNNFSKILKNNNSSEDQIVELKPIKDESEIPEIEEMDVVNRFVSNSHEKETIISTFENEYIIPKKSSFVLGDISNFGDHIPSGKKFSLFVMDPNWSNKSARRRNNYEVSHHKLKAILKDLPLDRNIHKNGCLIMIWVTNRIHYHKFIEQELIPFWKKKWKWLDDVRLISKLLWIKICENNELITQLEGDQGTKPYEHLFVVHCQTKSKKEVFSRKNIDLVFDEKKLKCFVNLPTIQHSQKPPLFDWVCELIGIENRSEIDCCELFARNLISGATSIGNEVLRFQNKKYFLKKEKL